MEYQVRRFVEHGELFGSELDVAAEKDVDALYIEKQAEAGGEVVAVHDVNGLHELKFDAIP